MKRHWGKILLALLLALILSACAPVLDRSDLPENTADLSGVLEQLEPSSLPETVKPENTPVQITREPAPDETDAPQDDELPPEDELLPEDGTYTSKDDVALYIHQYGKLPNNFISKSKARDLGWSGGSLEPYAPGMCIGGSRFGNYEGLLPEAEGRIYTECDIDTLGASSRGAKRIVFSNDGLIFYTDDHYESFELLYGEAGNG